MFKVLIAKLFIANLRKDYYLQRSYRDNISVYFQDEANRQMPAINKQVIKDIADHAAENFMRLWLANKKGK